MIIKRAHECPISVSNSLELVERVDKQCDYSYALVHNLDTSEEYANYFKMLRSQDREIFLDTSIFELGESFDPEIYVEWIQELRPNVYIVPDVLEDANHTIQNWIDFTKKYEDLEIGMRMGVVQGKSWAELRFAYQFMVEQADYIGISFDMSYYSSQLIQDTLQ